MKGVGKMDGNIQTDIQTKLSELFEQLLKDYGDTADTRLLIVRYTMGYMGASYGITVS